MVTVAPLILDTRGQNYRKNIFLKCYECDSTTMVVRLSDIRHKTGKKHKKHIFCLCQASKDECVKFCGLLRIYELCDFRTHFDPSLVKMYSMNVSKEFDDSWKLQFLDPNSCKVDLSGTSCDLMSPLLNTPPVKNVLRSFLKQHSFFSCTFLVFLCNHNKIQLI